MNPYLFTITFLLLMGMLTSSEVIRFSQDTLEKQCYFSSRSLMAATEELREWTHLEELRGEDPPEKEEEEKRAPKTKKEREPSKRIPNLRINISRPPDNSRLNLYRLLTEAENSKTPENYSLYDVVAQLIRDLYHDEPFFFPDVEYALLDYLLDQKAKALGWTTADQLCTLHFDDPKLQEALFNMLKGTKKVPSLLNFLTFDPIDSPQKPSRKINFLFADPHIIHALFPVGETANRLITRREAIWAAILEQENNRINRTAEVGKGRNEWNQEIKLLLEEVLTSEGFDAKKYLSQVFDYGLNEPGTLLFTHDPLSGNITRERYTPQIKSKL